MTDDILRIQRAGAVTVLAINNPSRRNAIGPDFFRAATQALAEAEADPRVGAVVLTGEGGFFSSGGNLKQLVVNRELSVEERRERIELLHGLVRTIRSTPLPVIAAVEGGAAGAGMSVALACDLVVSARDAVYSVAYIKAGLTPDGGITALLAESVPRQALTEMCLTGDRIGAERLAALGAITRTVEPGTALTEAIALAGRLADGPQRATERILALCRNAYDRTLDEQLDLEAESMVASQADAESAEGIAAVLEKRPADFVGVRTRTTDRADSRVD